MIARPGWARRFYRVVYVACEFVVLVGMLFGIPATIYVVAIANDVPVR